MSIQSGTNNDNEPPKWLVCVALATDKMVSAPEVMAKFQEKVREWAHNHAKTEDPVFPCFPHPRRAPTLLEEFALISAIHDQICTDATPINPWDGLEDSLTGADESVVEAAKENLRYCVAYDTLLSVRVPQLWECDSGIVEGWLEDVRAGLGLAKRIPRSEADLEKAAAASNDSNIAQPPATDNADKLESSRKAPAIDDEDRRILRVLHKQKPRMLTICTVSENAHVGNKTVGQRLKRLIECGLAVRPQGPNRGATITDEGIKLLESITTPE